MQFHQGSKLKKIVETGSLTIAEILNKSGISRGTLYNFFDYEEITRKKIKPVLDALQVDIDSFYNSPNVVKEDAAAYGLQATIDGLKREIELLKQQIETKDEIIELLKSKTKTTKK